MCCDTAVAVEALADASDFGFVGVAGGGKSVETPSQGAVSGPALFTVGGSNPHSGLGAAVVNEQSPFGLELDDVVVGNDNGFQRVYDNQILVSKNQLGSDPEQGCCGSNGGCCGSINSDVAVGSRVENRLNQEQGVEEQSDTAPNQIALRAINRRVLHLSIIAGTPVDGEGK